MVGQEKALSNGEIDNGQSNGTLWSYFNLNEWCMYLLFVLVGIGLRWILLDMRPLHHDESLHLIYGFYSFDHPDQQFYKYDPMLHGPWLYNFLPLVYAVIGWSEWAARAPIALIGSLFLFVPLFFRQYFSKTAVLVLTAALSLSPTMIYWSRFLREDFWVLSWWLLVAYGALLAPGRWRVALVFLGVVLQFCTKENSFVTLAVIVGYLLFEALYYCLTRIKGLLPKELSMEQSCFVVLMFQSVTRHWKAALIGVLFGGFVFFFFFTAQFRYSGGDPCLEWWNGKLCFGVLYDALWRKSIAYWFQHHQMERIKGPFLFHVYVLFWYELPFVLVWLLQIAAMFKRGIGFIRLKLALLLGVILILSLASFYITPDLRKWLEGSWIWSFCKLKDFRDFIGMIFLLCYAPLVTIHHLTRGERALAFWGYFFSATIFTYSYLGEKVPWLGVYPLVAGLVYFTLFFDAFSRQYRQELGWFKSVSWHNVLLCVGSVLVVLAIIFVAENQDGQFFREVLFENRYIFLTGGVILAFAWLAEWSGMLGQVNLKILLFVVFSVYSLRAALQTNYFYAGESNEYLSQVHTTYQFHRIALRIRDEMKALSKGYAPLLLVEGDATWPMTTYMIRMPEYRFTRDQKERAEFDYIITNWKDRLAIPEGFKVEKVHLRGWWVPDFGEVTLKKFLTYAVTHKPWNSEGYSDVALMTKQRDVVTSD